MNELPDKPTLGKMILLPPEKDKCQVCACAHDPRMPHNPQSFYYQIDFSMKHGRPPTWADAMEHCTQEMKDVWVKALAKNGVTVESPRRTRRTKP